MSKRAAIMIGMAAGVIWAFGLVFVSRVLLGPPSWGAPADVMAAALWPGGIVLCLMIGRLAQRRFFDDTVIDGKQLPEGSRAALDQKVLTNTMEQLVLALCLWPFIWVQMGDGAVWVLGLSFGLTRLIFWVGYHISPPLRGFGFAAGFYPTIVFTACALILYQAG